MRTALEACACPRGTDENLSAPHCKVVLDSGDGKGEGPIFVAMPAGLECPNARILPYGQFCMDENRLRLYRDFGV